MKHVWIGVIALALSGCGGSMPFGLKSRDRAAPVAEAGQTRPEARPDSAAQAPVPTAAARTAEQFDTTNAEERAEAAAPAAGGERLLGTTVVSLGDPTQPGFWLETPLVSATEQGRVVYPVTGKSAQVELRPSETGSRISLAAMRLIEAPLTDLPEVEVYSGE
ncbi:hypothetical protein [Tropicibacter alexandrii]|uniref:hypothetical protein n=1 Tax=Tropicibacter alexandrii TaxID=2267683 RepID=UPI000EF506B7|nr:hypothetical protein [Tropicibacter alexandrii]